MAISGKVNAKIMIVDDEPLIREAVIELLDSAGIAVLAAASGDDCLNLLRDGFRGIILMDVMMPGKNGWQTLRAMERESLLSGNIIAMLTALDAPDEQMEGLQELVMDYITKPFESAEFLSTIRRYLGCLDQMPEEG